jgi:hypothetical protein
MLQYQMNAKLTNRITIVWNLNPGPSKYEEVLTTLRTVSYNGEDSSLLVCYAMLPGKWILVF